MQHLMLRFRQFWFAEASDGWHYSVFRMFWAQFHFTFALYMFYWTYQERGLDVLPYPGALSVFSLLSTELVLGLCIVQLLAGFWILVGWHTRFFQIVTAVLAAPILFHSVSAYQNHYVFYLLIVLYMTLMPSERFFSLDALRMRRKLSAEDFAAWRGMPVSLFPQRLIQLQLAFLYLFAALNKLDPIWFARWSTTPELAALARSPLLANIWMQLVEAGIAWVPLLALALLLLSFSFGIFVANRYPLVVFLGVCVHLSFQFTLHILEFTPMCMAILFLSLFPIQHRVTAELLKVVRR